MPLVTLAPVVLKIDHRDLTNRVTIDQVWLVKFVAHRSGDRCVVRHRWRRLKARVPEDGQGREQEEGMPPEGSISPLAANIDLHDALARWAERWRQREARGDMIIVLCADDVIGGFEPQDDAERFWTARGERCQKVKLELHSEKTRLLECGRFAAERRQRRGQGTPETFDCLGLTHSCSKTRQGKLTVRRKTIAKRLRKTRQDVKAALRERLHGPIPQQGAWWRRGLLGPYREDAVPRNGRLLNGFRETVMRYWCRTLRRRSQRHRMTWQRLSALVEQ